MRERYLLTACIFLSVMIMPCFVYAAPSISSISGQCADGSQITISGAEFGDSGPNIAIFDDFEKGSPGSKIRTGKGSSSMGQWDTLGRNTPYYTNEYAHSGSLAFQADCGSDATSTKIHASASFPGTREFFGIWWVYLPENDYWPGEGGRLGTNWKQVWFRRDSGPTNTSDVICSTILGKGYNVAGAITGNCVGGYTRYVHSQTKGIWCRTQFYWIGSRSGIGACKLTYLLYNGKDRVFVAVDEKGITNACDDTPYSMVYCGAYGRPAGGPSHPTYDDFYIATGKGCRARVEIGDNPRYKKCTNLTICTVDSWAANLINATVRQGSFRLKDYAYIFVVDSDGGVSKGYPVVIGQDQKESGDQ